MTPSPPRNTEESHKGGAELEKKTHEEYIWLPFIL